MIIDAFPFFNELDILEARLEYLNDVVDYFVIVESNITHSGKPKPFHFKENEKRYERFKDKIIYHPYIFDISQTELNFDVKLDTFDSTSAHWTVERAQRDHITQCLDRFDDESCIMISDADEIPHKDAIRFAKENLIPGIDCAAFIQKLFYYNLKTMALADWHGTVFAKVGLAKRNGTQWFRDNREHGGIPKIQWAGWHFSYFGSVNKIIEKIESFSHQELNKEYFKDPERIKQAINQGQDLYERPWDQFTQVDSTYFPSDLLNALRRFHKNTNLESAISDLPSAWTGHKDFAIWLMDYVNPKVTVDLGVDYGYSTFVLGSANLGKVYGIDCFAGDEHAGFRDTFEYVTNIKNNYKFDNITFIQGYFDQIAQSWVEPIDILHIDGLHTYEAVKHDYETWEKFLKDDSVILFHDTVAFESTVVKFFNEINLPKTMFTHSAGLGIVSKNPRIIKDIEEKFSLQKTSKIQVFVHLVDFPEGLSIAKEQIELIITSGLINHCDLHLHCNYNINNYSWLVDRLKDYKNVVYLESNALPQEYEIPTLINLKTFCDQDTNDSYVLYLHQKGVTRPYSQPVSDWRDLMLYFNVEQWENCVDKLSQGYDTVGVNWHKDHKYPHYSGNFWWAKASYIKELPGLTYPRENNFLTQLGLDIGEHKLDSEFWLGLETPNALSLHDSQVDHYNEIYPSHLYKNTSPINEFYQGIPGNFTSEDAKFYREVIDKVTNSSKFLEINPGVGRSTACLMQLIINSKKDIQLDVIVDNQLLDQFKNNLNPVDGRYNCVIDYTVGLTKFYQDQSLDFVFIYSPIHNGLAQEIQAWLPKIKQGGMIAGYNFFTVDNALSVAKNLPNINVRSLCWSSRII